MADRTSLLVIVAYLAGLGMLVYELQKSPSAPPPPPKQAVEALPPLELPPIAINSIAIYDAIIERPLFNADRRPDPVDATPTEVVNAAEPVDEVDGYRLAAVIKGFGNSTALIEDSSGNTQTLHPGEKLGKWELQEIQDDRVVLLSGTRQETLLVYRFDPVVPNQKPTRRPPSVPQRNARTLRRPALLPPVPADRKPPNPPNKP